ncbi:MAG TPA: FAD-dependent oxidoreductase [Candidatus Limnocylindrales bacterium]|nr:FAD-dependent oxidoreductase [Candidatus Limnocylindrales bacterium]
MSRARIIIIGGGFGGVKCAQTLTRGLTSEEAEVVLFDRQNHLVFSPLLAEVVGSSLNPLDCIVPLRQLLPRVYCRTEEVRGIDAANRQIEYQAADSQWSRMSYDHLVIACGNATNLNVVPGMADHAFPLKTLADAYRLRSHLMGQMEQAEVSTAVERRCWRLTVVVVGGGYSGVESAGEINDLLRDSARYFHNWTKSDVKVILIHAHDEILPEISPGLRQFARRKMERAGVEFILNARVTSATPEGVGLQGAQFIRGGTIVCTIGSSCVPVVESLSLPKEKARMATEPDMRVKGQSNVWAIGDCAWIVNSYNGQPCPTTGQFAERQGRQCANNIIRLLKQQPTKPFRFKQLGELCSIGGHSAVADLFGFHLSGFLAWFAWRGIYLFKLPSLGHRLQVGFDWAWLLVFPRDLTYIRTEQTERVSHAHYNEGEFIFHKGEAPTNFYVLEKGEVEILRATDGTGEDVVAVLGPGSFFGERALVDNRPRVMSVRARTAVEVLVMGRNVFTQVSGALAPFRDALAQTLNRRTMDAWKGRPHIYELLHRSPIQQLVEPVPQPLLKPDATLRQVSQAFVEHGNEFFYVSTDGQMLEGVVTITDLLRGGVNRSDGIAVLKDFMTKEPVAISLEDNCAVAADVIREYRLKSLPVVDKKGSRKLVGCVRIRRLMAFVLKETGGQATPQTADAASASATAPTGQPTHQ